MINAEIEQLLDLLRQYLKEYDQDADVMECFATVEEELATELTYTNPIRGTTND